MQTKIDKAIHDDAECIEIRNLRKLLRDANRGAELNARVCRLQAESWWELRNAADEFLAAAVCYHENQWDRVNVRKYAAAKDALNALLHPKPPSAV